MNKMTVLEQVSRAGDMKERAVSWSLSDRMRGVTSTAPWGRVVPLLGWGTGLDRYTLWCLDKILRPALSVSFCQPAVSGLNYFMITPIKSFCTVCVLHWYSVCHKSVMTMLIQSVAVVASSSWLPSGLTWVTNLLLGRESGILLLELDSSPLPSGIIPLSTMVSATPEPRHLYCISQG